MEQNETETIVLQLDTKEIRQGRGGAGNERSGCCHDGGL